MNRILIVTYAWHPQVNGVVRTMQNVIDHLRAHQFELGTITPDMFYTVPLPVSPEVQLSLFSAHKYVKKIVGTPAQTGFCKTLFV